jgi:predicted Fe-Mo cluster-binding NifX family protein
VLKIDKIMKIAIPTNDGEVILKGFKGSRGFMVTTIESGKIIHQELRWNLLSEIMTSEHGSFYNLCDCDTIIVNEIGLCQCARLKAENKEIIQTVETRIKKVFGEFLNGGRSNFISL